MIGDCTETALEIRHLVPDDHVETEHSGVRHLRSSAINKTPSAGPRVFRSDAIAKRSNEDVVARMEPPSMTATRTLGIIGDQGAN